MSKHCPACGQLMPGSVGRGMTDAELDALSAWWHTGTIKAAADLLSRAERTIINQLYNARIRDDVHTTLELAQLHLGELRTMGDLLAQHNSRLRRVA